MKESSADSSLTLFLITLLTSGIFLVDALTPPGWAVWILYLLPLFAANRLPHPGAPAWLGAICTVLTVIGCFFFPRGIVDSVIIFNCAAAITVFGVTGLLIMNRKHATEALTESESRFRTLVNTSSQSVWRYLPGRSLTQQIDHANHAWWCEFTGQTDAQWTANGGMGWIDAVHEDDRAAALRGWASLDTLTAREPVEAAFRVQRHDGQWHWFAVNGVPHLRDAQGLVTEWVGTITDITEHKRAAEEILASHERLAQVTRQLIGNQENERRHLARELHDEVGQVLTAVFYDLQTLKTARQPMPPSRLDESLAVVDRAIQQVRTMSLDLRPSMLDDLGLAPTIKWYAERLAGSTGLTIHLLAPPSAVDLPADVRTACFRVAQEAMTNISRHAKAKHVRLELVQTEEEVRLIIHDDGVGFDLAAARRRAARGGSIGILGMQERVELVGGQFAMESDQGNGTTIRVRFDLQELARLAQMGFAGGGVNAEAYPYSSGR